MNTIVIGFSYHHFRPSFIFFCSKPPALIEHRCDAPFNCSAAIWPFKDSGYISYGFVRTGANAKAKLAAVVFFI